MLFTTNTMSTFDMFSFTFRHQSNFTTHTALFFFCPLPGYFLGKSSSFLIIPFITIDVYYIHRCSSLIRNRCCTHDRCYLMYPTNG